MAQTVTEHNEESLGATQPQNVTAHTADGKVKDRPDETNGDKTFGITDRQKKTYGIASDFVPSWVRNPEHPVWKNIGEDRVEEVMDEYPGAKAVFKKDGSQVRKGDLCLMQIPRVLMEQREKEEQQARAEYEKGFREIPQAAEGTVGKIQNLYKKPREMNEEELNLYMYNLEREKAFNTESGLIGPTAGWSLEQCYDRFSAKEIEAEQARFRRGPIHHEMSEEEFEAHLPKVEAARDAERRARRNYNVGASIGPTTRERVAARVGKPK